MNFVLVVMVWLVLGVICAGALIVVIDLWVNRRPRNYIRSKSWNEAVEHQIRRILLF